MQLDSQNTLLKPPAKTRIPEDLLRWLRDSEQYLDRYGDQKDQATRLVNELRVLAEKVYAPQPAFADQRGLNKVSLFDHIRERAKTVRVSDALAAGNHGRTLEELKALGQL